MPPLTCDDTESSDRSPICHTLVHPVYLGIHGLTCRNVELTHLEAVAIFRFAPSSRSGRRERAGRAAGHRKVNRTRGTKEDPRGSERVPDHRRTPRGRIRWAPPGRRKVSRAGGPRETGRREATRSPRMTGERREASHRRRSGSRAKNAEVAWGTRAREAEGGWELRFPASRRSLGFSLFLLSSAHTSSASFRSRALFR